MDWEKYNQIPTEFATAREIGLAAATLAAMARRGLVEVLDSVPKQYRRIDSIAAKIYQLCEENKKYYDTYFSLRKKDHDIGMLCSISNNTIVDCWGNKYDLTDIDYACFGKKEFYLEEDD